MDKHTPGPWTLAEIESGLPCDECGKDPEHDCKMPTMQTEIVDPNGYPIATMMPGREENAAYIVRAVNCHEELLASLKYAIEHLKAAHAYIPKDLMEVVARVEVK